MRICSVYELPAGSDYRLIKGSAEYIAICAHPDRKPWFVTHDGREVEVVIETPFKYHDVSFLPDRGAIR